MDKDDVSEGTEFISTKWSDWPSSCVRIVGIVPKLGDDAIAELELIACDYS